MAADEAQPPPPDDPTPRAPAEEQQPQEQQPDEHTAAPASPPLPARHTAVTPGPRAARLEELYATTLAHALARVSWDNFAACYPTVAARAPETLRHVQRQMVDRLGELCHKEFAAILQSRNVVAKLNELESLVSEAARRKEDAGAGQKKGGKQNQASQAPPVPPHLLPASDILAAHLAPHLAAHQSQLNARLQTSQAHNARLFEEVRAQRAEVAALLGEVERALADAEGASTLLEGVAGELAAETRAVEVEMGGM